ncbi:Aste57867_11490 [Aphanomyces stellatus]|uniref:Aste57867_11490 protein n=1 Tax=Aphanomyces stellatus TaxID=120398 RepID=A0A485KT71_9STRA|nr:hypothetical protein As57867_011447 [Aphanomyces stellatus]VFT88351.1 Aste57867_11490 [Aphanomyces stellatus]
MQSKAFVGGLHEKRLGHWDQRGKSLINPSLERVHPSTPAEQLQLATRRAVRRRRSQWWVWPRFGHILHPLLHAIIQFPSALAPAHTMNRGLLDGLLAYIIFGLYPLYWKLLSDVPSMQLLSHRLVWSVPLCLIVVFATGQGRALLEGVRSWRNLGIYTVSGLLIGINLYLSVWAVNAGFIVEMSLGYFINPVVSVLLGVVFLKERLRLWQWLSVALSVAGVAVVTVGYGKFPYIALTLAFAFGFYGLVSKLAPLTPVVGVTIEMSILVLPGLIYLILCEANGTGAFGHSSAGLNWLMVGCGPMTVTPQLLFVMSVQTIPLSILGVIQFLSPTMNILIGVLIYDENFSGAKMVGFIMVWVSLVMFTVESFTAKTSDDASPTMDDALVANDADKLETGAKDDSVATAYQLTDDTKA